MSKDLRSLIDEHHAFYEVSPYYLVLKEKPGSLMPNTRTIQAGFDVDIFGMNTNEEPLLPGPDYLMGYAEVQRLAEEISRHTTDSCSLHVIAFPDRVALGGPSHTEPEGMLRVRISHHRGLDQPYGLAEEQALKELENQLKQLGIARH
jgi:hypothetical protein